MGSVIAQTGGIFGQDGVEEERRVGIVGSIASEQVGASLRGRSIVEIETPRWDALWLSPRYKGEAEKALSCCYHRYTKGVWLRPLEPV